MNDHPLRAPARPSPLRRMALCGLALCWIACAACRGPAPICVDIRPDTDRPNHLQPFDLAIDPARRILYSTSLASPNVAVVDLDGLVIDHVLRIGDSALVQPDVAVADDGRPWVSSQSTPGVIRLDTDGGARSSLGDRFAAARALVAIPDGMVVSGRPDDADVTSELVRLDLDGTVQANITLAERAPALLYLADDDALLVLTSGPALELRDPRTLALRTRCDLPASATRAAALDDGSYVLASETAVIHLHCPGDDVQTWPLGTEITGLVSVGDEALALDRIGPGGDWDPNAGVVWRVGPAGPADAPAFATGKNSGFGDIDPDTGWLWVNSEGTTEVQAYDPQTGELRARVRLGRFIDGLAVAGDHQEQLVVTGRLSDTLLRVEDGRIAAEVRDDEATRWPYAPTTDPARNRLWVRSQTDASLSVYDLDTLELQATLALGSPPDPGLVFGTMLLDPDRDRIYVTEPWVDALFEVDPESITVTARWPLGGPRLTDRDAIGELALQLDPIDGALLVIRTTDGRVQRVNPDENTILTVRPDVDLATDPPELTVDSTGLDLAHDVLYVTGKALDRSTLARRPHRDRDVARVVGTWPGEPGELLAQSADQLDLVHLDSDGEPVGSRNFASRELHPTVIRLAEDQAVAWISRTQGGLVCPYGLEDGW